MIRGEIENMVRGQQTKVTGHSYKNPPDATVCVRLTDYPNVYKQTTDRILGWGWYLSGVTDYNELGKPDGNARLYFRPLED